MATNVQTVAHDLAIERTQDVKTEEDVTFEGMFLSDKTMEGLKKCGFVKPSPIQLKAIPLGKCGFDLIVEAKSGTGKTAVFSVVALESIQLELGCQCIIVVPTREMAVQIQQVITAIGVAYEGLNVEIAIGGTKYPLDKKKLLNTKYQIIVGTPGRLKHYIESKVLSVDAVRLFVLDEADRLMEQYLQVAVNYIYSSLPTRKQVIATSATYTPHLCTFLADYMNSPSHINPYNSRILLGVNQYVSIVEKHHNKVKQNEFLMLELIRILSNIQFKQCLVFCNYQATTHNTCNFLCEKGWPAAYLASSQTQEERLKSLHKLQAFECRVLVATDLASRGLDSAHVDLVINIGNPHDISTYLHRTGRCGRYGGKGNTIIILPEGMEKKFYEMLNIYGDSFNFKPISDIIDDKSDIKEIKGVCNGPNQINLTSQSKDFEGYVDDFAKSLNLRESENKEIKSEPNRPDQMDLTPLFKNNHNKYLDEILKSYDQENFNKLIDPDIDYGLEDFYSSFLPKTPDVETPPEFDYINYLKKTVPDYDKLTKYFEDNFICKDVMMDGNSNIMSSVQMETNIESLTNNVSNLNISQMASDQVQPQNSPVNIPLEPDVFSGSVDVEFSEDSESGDIECVSNYEYLKWRQQLAVTSAFVEQSVYLQTLIHLRNMDPNNM